MNIEELIHRAWIRRDINTRCVHILNSAVRQNRISDIVGLKNLNDFQWLKIRGSGKRSMALIKKWISGLPDDGIPPLPDSADDFVKAVIEKHNTNQAKWGGNIHDDEHEFADWILFLELRLLEMKKIHYTASGDSPENSFVSAAAVCYAAFNSLRRKAANCK